MRAFLLRNRVLGVEAHERRGAAVAYVRRRKMLGRFSGATLELNVSTYDDLKVGHKAEYGLPDAKSHDQNEIAKKYPIRAAYAIVRADAFTGQEAVMVVVRNVLTEQNGRVHQLMVDPTISV
ncbi:hypothetical protein G7068_14905 [Leucobacter viscericola]|uniref:Uncharacterized protein n=1 Tax=Leucobacter viscericola TaxID=2714935 RepID=A0A6G7XIT9_9MICO|nr:hypothetical protein [Leucobacter viscericola]QIK64349.1 hypothetical protein G7068_14905 [Leucobacter viscericola]